MAKIHNQDAPEPSKPASRALSLLLGASVATTLGVPSLAFAADEGERPGSLVAASADLRVEAEAASASTAESASEAPSASFAPQADPVVQVTTADGVVTAYDTIPQAVAAATPGSTLRLLADADLSNAGVLDIDNLTLDLGGHTIAALNFTLIFQGDHAVIRNGAFDSKSGSYGLFVGDARDTADVVLEGLTIAGGINVFNAHGVVLRDVTVTVSPLSRAYYALWCDENAQVVVESGTYESHGQAIIGMAAAETDTSLLVKGGSYIAGTRADGNPTSVVLEGDGFNTPVIYQGSFNVPVPKEYLAEGVVMKEVDGQYVVDREQPDPPVDPEPDPTPEPDPEPDPEPEPDPDPEPKPELVPDPEPPSQPAVAVSPVFRLLNPATGEHLFTTAQAERAALLRAGWADEGQGWGAPGVGTPVHRLLGPDGQHFYTGDGGEMASLLNGGWHYEGVAWYSIDGQGVPVRRLLNGATGQHHFTASKTEVAALTAQGWSDEGVAWYGMDAGSSAASPEISPISVFRLLNPATGAHLFTTAQAERSALLRAGWTDEGQAWSAQAAGIPVHRFFNPWAGFHFFTADIAEMNGLLRAGWSYEGVAFCSAGSQGAPIYRLCSPDGRHLFTASAVERDAAAKVGWTDEGVAFQGVR